MTKESPTRRPILALSVIAGAMIFGMVLASGLDLAPPGQAAPGASATQPPDNGARPALAGVTSLPSFADLFESIESAVVSVATYTVQSTSTRPNPFEFFFDPRRRQQGEETPREFRSDSGGSGFVISADGLVITNFHVIDGATQVRVHLNDRDYEAEVKGTDPATDIALLKIDAGKNLTYLKLGNSERLRVGDWVVAIGNPLRLEKTVTVGVVSAKGRSIGLSRDVSFEDFIQTDAAINFGNSGGPLVNLDGEVVGIATAINYGAENIGFAVPVDTLKQILPQLEGEGKVRRGYLGVTVDNLDYPTARAFGLESTAGALVESVQPGTPADRAGLHHGDIILKVDEIEVQRTRELIDYVSAQGPDATVDLEILRNGKVIQKQVKLAERAADRTAAAPVQREGAGSIDWLGIRFRDLTPDLLQRHGLPDELRGVWVTEVAPASPLYEENVRPGDTITEVNGQPVTESGEFERLVGQAGSGSFLRFYIRRVNAQTGADLKFFAVVQVP